MLPCQHRTMSPERLPEVENLYRAARELAPENRAAFLYEACGQDPALRHEVESLLARQMDAPPPGQEAAPQPAEEATQTMGPAAAVGAQLGPYRILGLLGAGGMGEVYRAKDTRLGREVALKLLPRERVADPERQRRFLREARAASALNHPNIVTFFDLARAGGQDFLVMEYVAGQALNRSIPGNGLPLRQALSYAIQIADAMAAAHAAGVVHRDLKPANIIVSEKGAIKLLDFGLAKLAEPEPASGEAGAGAAPLTSSGLIMGTLSYMSPEQAEGKPADARSDIFSFGAVLYEMVTGQRAFRGGDSPASKLSAILRDEPPPASSLSPGVPRDLEKIILRCLRKDAARRFQHAGDLKLALLELQEELDAGAVAAPLPTRKSRGRTWLRFALVPVILAAIGGGSWFLYRRALPIEAPLTALPFTAYPGYELDPAFSPDGNQVAFEWEGEKRENSDIYIKLIGPGEPRRLTTDTARDHSPAWSPDSRGIAFVRELPNHRSAVMLIPALGGSERKLAEIASPVLEYPYLGNRALTWTPDSKWLVVPDRGSPGEPLSLFLLSVDTGEKRRLTSPRPPFSADRSPAFSADGRWLAFSRNTTIQVSDIYLLSLSADLHPEGGPKPLTHDGRWNDSPNWLADGREILFSSNRDGGQNLWRAPSSGASRPRRVPLSGTDSTFPAFSRRADRLIYAQRFQDGNVWRMDCRTLPGRPPRQQC